MLSENFDDSQNRDLVFKARAVNAVRQDFLGLVGQSQSGDFLLFPDSYRQGYRDAFPGINGERRMLELDLIIAGRLSDGTIVFPYSYRSGLAAGTVQADQLRFSMLAERQKVLNQQNLELERRQQITQACLEQALDKIAHLESQGTDSAN